MSLKSTIEEMQEIAKSRNGECLSIAYINGKSYLEWKCSNNHTWKAKACTIKEGKWCPHCRKLTNE